jgi:hypothetical protein
MPYRLFSKEMPIQGVSSIAAGASVARVRPNNKVPDARQRLGTRQMAICSVKRDKSEHLIWKMFNFLFNWTPRFRTN